jgi:hypothetical protein
MESKTIPVAPPPSAAPDGAASMAKRLKDVEKTASYLSSGKVPTPPNLGSVRPQPMRRSSGAHTLPTGKVPTPPLLNSVRPQPMRRASGANAIPPAKMPTPPQMNAVKPQPPGRGSGRYTLPPRTLLNNAKPATSQTPPPGTLRASAASGSKPSFQPKWHCEKCQMPVDKEGVVNGTCKLVEGKLYCLRCIRKEAASRNLRVTLWAMGGFLIVGLVVSALFLTQPLLILLIPIGILAVLTGIVGGGLGGTARLAFVAAGLTAMVGSSYGTSLMNERAEARAAQQALERQAVQVQDMIEKKQFATAESRIETLASQNKGIAGRSTTPEQEKTLDALKQRLNSQIKATYGDLNPHESHVLMSLLRAFPDGSDGGAQRLKSVHMTDTKVSIAVEKSPDLPNGMPTGPMGDPSTLQARTIALFLFDSYPFLKETDIEVSGGDKGPVRHSFSREQITQLRLGGMPPPIAIPEAQKSVRAHP